MRVLLPILVLIAALAALLMVPSEKPIFGMNHGAFGGASLGAAMLVFFIANGALRIGPSAIARVVGSALIWALVIVLLAEVYAYRFEFADIGARMLEDLIPSEPTVGQGGEVIIRSRFGGEFVVPAKVNDRPVNFVFDTGATNVVLTAEDAARIGVDPRALDFEAPVATANGSALAAPIRLDRVSVGPIVVRNVRALVTRPGAMRESLLGMSFLERLDSFAVERGKLVLKAK